MEKFLNIMICPNGNTLTEVGDTPYFHSVYFSLESEKGKGKIDMQLPNGDYLHSTNTANGIFLLIERKITTQP